MDEHKTYVINFYYPGAGDPYREVVAPLNRYLTDSVDILGFWNYIPLLYCVKTKLSASALREKI